MPLNDSGRNACLLGGITNVVTHLGLLTAVSDSSPTEVTGGSPAYARKAVTAWAAPATGVSTAPSVGVTFDIPAATTVLAVSYHSAVSAGTFYGWAPLNGTAAKRGFGTVNATDVTNDTITSNGHTLVNTDRVILNGVMAESMPAGLTEVTTTYYVVGAATDTFQVSLTSGGAAVNITGQGELYFQHLIPETFASQGTLTVAINAVTLELTVI